MDAGQVGGEGASLNGSNRNVPQGLRSENVFPCLSFNVERKAVLPFSRSYLRQGQDDRCFRA